MKKLKKVKWLDPVCRAIKWWGWNSKWLVHGSEVHILTHTPGPPPRASLATIRFFFKDWWFLTVLSQKWCLVSDTLNFMKNINNLCSSFKIKQILLRKTLTLKNTESSWVLTQNYTSTKGPPIFPTLLLSLLIKLHFLYGITLGI